MGGFRTAGQDQVNAFEIEDRYLFKHYFDGDDVFQRMRKYYNQRQYRFEVPTDDFPEIRSFLDEHGYGMVTVDATEEFVVVVKKYTAHPDNIFKQSVMQRSTDGYNCFLMKDQTAVEQATHNNAVRLTDTPLENPF